MFLEPYCRYCCCCIGCCCFFRGPGPGPKPLPPTTLPSTLLPPSQPAPPTRRDQLPRKRLCWHPLLPLPAPALSHVPPSSRPACLPSAPSLPSATSRCSCSTGAVPLITGRAARGRASRRLAALSSPASCPKQALRRSWLLPRRTCRHAALARPATLRACASPKPTKDAPPPCAGIRRACHPPPDQLARRRLPRCPPPQPAARAAPEPRPTSSAAPCASSRSVASPPLSAPPGCNNRRFAAHGCFAARACASPKPAKDAPPRVPFRRAASPPLSAATSCQSMRFARRLPGPAPAPTWQRMRRRACPFAAPPRRLSPQPPVAKVCTSPGDSPRRHPPPCRSLPIQLTRLPISHIAAIRPPKRLSLCPRRQLKAYASPLAAPNLTRSLRQLKPAKDAPPSPRWHPPRETLASRPTCTPTHGVMLPSTTARCSCRAGDAPRGPRARCSCWRGALTTPVPLSARPNPIYTLETMLSRLLKRCNLN